MKSSSKPCYSKLHVFQLFIFANAKIKSEYETFFPHGWPEFVLCNTTACVWKTSLFECFQRKRGDIRSSSIQTRSKAHDIIKRMLASLGDPYTRFLSPDEVIGSTPSFLFSIAFNENKWIINFLTETSGLFFLVV